MSKRILFLAVLLAGAAAVATPASVGATTYDNLTYLTFSGPVQVPGATLTPGTYRFRLADPDSGRGIIQVLSHEGNTVYAMFLTMPDHRWTVTEHSTVTFRETPAGVPPAVKSLFYGGETRGYEFVYPRGGPKMTATGERPQPGVTYTPIPAPATPIGEAKPIAEPTPMVEPEMAVEPAPANVSNAESLIGEPTAEPSAAELPKTASPVPLVALGGLGSILLGLGAGLLGRRNS